MFDLISHWLYQQQEIFVLRSKRLWEKCIPVISFAKFLSRHAGKTPSNKTQAQMKSMKLGIWVMDKSNQKF